MPCSAVTLSLATITSIIAVALLAIAFATDNWLYIEVRRTNIQNFLSRNSDVQSQSLLDAVNSKYYYYTRTKGLFRTCFPKERPPTLKLYLSPVETYCTNVNYYIPDENNETKDFTEDAWTRLHMGRSMIALFILSFLAVFAAFCTGVTGCWKRSPGNVTATAILMLLACLLSAGAMGLWHGVEYFEKEKQVGEEFYQQWSTLLQDNTTTYYDWGFALGWLGVFSCLGGSLLFFFGSCCLQAEKDREQMDNVQYIVPVGARVELNYSDYKLCYKIHSYNHRNQRGMPVCFSPIKVLRDQTRIYYDWGYMLAWAGVGWALTAAILFSGAAICLRGEREREEAINMQYLMPVYPQKQQYAYAGYPVPPQQYSGPYYTTGSAAYGPYNY